MQYEEINLKVVSESGETEVFKFEGYPIGRARRKYDDDHYSKKTVEIFHRPNGTYLIYVHFHKEEEISRADLVTVTNLDFIDIRRALKETGVYPGPMFSEAVYHSLNTLELLR